MNTALKYAMIGAALGWSVSASLAQQEPIVPGKGGAGGGAAHSAGPKAGAESPKAGAEAPKMGAEAPKAAEPGTMKPAQAGEGAKAKPAEAAPAAAEGKPAEPTRKTTEGKPAEPNRKTTEEAKPAEGKPAAATNKPAEGAAGKQTSSETTKRVTNVHVTDVQRTKIRETIRSVNVRPVEHVNFNLSVGIAVPRTIVLNPLPPAIVEIVPEYRGYEFFLTGDTIVVVDPETFEIVAVLPA